MLIKSHNIWSTKKNPQEKLEYDQIIYSIYSQLMHFTFTGCIKSQRDRERSKFFLVNM